MALGIQPGGHPTIQFSKKSVGKCLKMAKNKRKKVISLGMQDNTGHPKEGRKNE